MMRTCNICPEWAQWRVSNPTYDKDGKLINLELIAMLCSGHKQDQEKMPTNAELLFNFIGYSPLMN